MLLVQSVFAKAHFTFVTLMIDLNDPSFGALFVIKRFKSGLIQPLKRILEK